MASKRPIKGENRLSIARVSARRDALPLCRPGWHATQQRFADEPGPLSCSSLLLGERLPPSVSTDHPQQPACMVAPWVIHLSTQRLNLLCQDRRRLFRHPCLRELPALHDLSGCSLQPMAPPAQVEHGHQRLTARPGDRFGATRQAWHSKKPLGGNQHLRSAYARLAVRGQSSTQLIRGRTVIHRL